MIALLAVHQRNTAVDDLRFYLRAWRRWVRSWRAPLGFPSEWPLARIPVKAPVSCGNIDDSLEEPYYHQQEIEEHILRAVDAEVESLDPKKRAAVRLVYLNELGPSVFRSMRMSEEEAKSLTCTAELEMVPRLRIRGVVLGGH